MNPSQHHLHPVVERARRAVLVVDMVESVRLIEEDEEDTISRWLDLVRRIENELLPANEGHLVKSLGDGVLLEFNDVRAAVLAAFAIQEASSRDNAGKPANRQILLRIGIEIGDVIIQDRDVYGHGVNLAARFAGLAGPGETVVSASVREQITPDLDADVEDLGECFLKHVKEPVRAYRITPPGAHPVSTQPVAAGNLLPTLAVIPFLGRSVPDEHQVLGEILAEEMIRECSCSTDLNVISRLSTTAFRGRIASLDEFIKHLNANYVLSGTYRVNDEKVVLNAELAEAKSSTVVWSQRLEDKIGGVITGEQEIIGRVVADVRSAVMSNELKRARSQALPTLESYSLLMGAVALMHRMHRPDFERARELLQNLIDRMPRQPMPYAWLAKWHVLRWQQGWTDSPQEDSDHALASAKKALDADPQSSLALAVDGLVRTHFTKQLDLATQSYEMAVESNPNDSLAWLHKGALQAFMDNGKMAVESARRALSLSPLDVHRYYYDSLAATASLSAHRYGDALRLAQRSLRANKAHTSTMRVKAVAQWQLGLHEDARTTGQELLTLEPALTVDSWLRRSPSSEYRIGKEIADVLRQLGIPK